MITLIRGFVWICVCFSLAAEAAPSAVTQRFVVTAHVPQVDCTTRPVKIRACAPVVITTEAPQTGILRTRSTTTLYY